LLFKNLRNPPGVTQRIFLLIWLLCSCCSFGMARKPVELGEAGINPGYSDQISSLCSSIYQGRFDETEQNIKKAKLDSEDYKIAELTQIVKQFQDITRKCLAEKEQAYEEKIIELEKAKAAADANGLDDVNDISNVLAIVAQAREFADEQQTKALLTRAFVQQAIALSKNKASDFEAKGDWLDAYIHCYSLLAAIEQDNDLYSEYAERLIDKANIVASFQDSPCESGKQRYEGIRKRMFIRAINTLEFNYVSYPDYRSMATKAIKHCKLLAEVMKVSFDEITKSQESLSSTKDTNSFFTRPNDDSLAAWSVVLTALADEVNCSTTGTSKDKFINVFERVMAVNTTTVQLPEKMLIAQFAESSFSALDPYTAMIWPKQVEDFEKNMTNKFTGIGIQISKTKGQLTASSLLPDTPAYNSGLDAGDLIIAVDGADTKEIPLDCAVKLITGPAGTDVTLTIKRAGVEKPFDITITRAAITVPTIRGWQRNEDGNWLYMVNEKNKIGYIRITGFSAGTAGDFEQALCELEAEGMKGLILDLRFNSGGLLSSAIEVTDKFVNDNLIVSTRPKFGLGTYASATREGTHPNFPMVVLINSSSASASEIVAGALQDKKHNRAILVGQRTYGKGSVQGISSYPEDGAQMKYTTAYYHLPSGQRVESRSEMEKQGRKDWGVGPDVEVILTREEAIKMADIQNDNAVLVKADHDNGSSPINKHDIEETLSSDPQLAIGILVVRTKQIEAQATTSKKGFAVKNRH
jgi:carboxyl-terminal processing protease